MIATICSSENRPFRIAPSESGASLSTYRWSENPRAGHWRSNMSACRFRHVYSWKDKDANGEDDGCSRHPLDQLVETLAQQAKALGSIGVDLGRF
jgi:hypothetical protein